MITHELIQTEWASYFDLFSRSTSSKTVEIEVVSLALGDQIEVKWTELKGIVYDSKKDIFYIYTRSLNHQIFHPKQIFLQENGGLISAIEIKDTSDESHILKLKDPLMLSAHNE